MRRLAGEPRFDYLCWDLYTEVSRWIEEDPAGPAARQEALHGLEHGEEPWAGIGRIVANAIARRHLETMERIGVRYDLLPLREVDPPSPFLGAAFEAAPGRRRHPPERVRPEPRLLGHGTESRQDGEKVIVRSNATVTYVGKDIAYQMWQLGLLDRDFRWRRFYEYSDGSRAWMSTSGPEEPDTPSFGAARRSSIT